MGETLRELLQSNKPRLTLILGASDTGKTTLIEQLLTEWHPGEPVAVVDCDVGQSHVGPPTTVGWGIVPRPFTGWRNVDVRGIAFTGCVSPEGNVETFLQTVVRMVESATRSARYLLIDTTGLVHGEIGMALKRRKVELFKPDLIIAIQRERELGALLASLPSVPIERLAASSNCVRRSLSERAAYRDEQFARYFSASVKHSLALSRIRLVGLGPEWPSGQVAGSPAALIDCVVGLRNERGEDAALGLVRAVNREESRVELLTPQRDVSEITTLAVGSIRWPAQPEEAG